MISILEQTIWKNLAKYEWGNLKCYLIYFNNVGNYRGHCKLTKVKITKGCGIMGHRVGLRPV